MGLACGNAANADHMDDLVNLLGANPDIIIADVECPGDGRIFTEPYFGTLRQPKGLEDVTIQVQILTNALHAVHGGGLVSYSTCSVNPLINESVVHLAANAVGSVKSVSPYIDEIHLFPPVGTVRMKSDAYRIDNPMGIRAYPHTMMEGFYCALLERN